jgi:hypothetical protein
VRLDHGANCVRPIGILGVRDPETFVHPGNQHGDFHFAWPQCEAGQLLARQIETVGFLLKSHGEHLARIRRAGARGPHAIYPKLPEVHTAADFRAINAVGRARPTRDAPPAAEDHLRVWCSPVHDIGIVSAGIGRREMHGCSQVVFARRHFDDDIADVARGQMGAHRKPGAIE